MPPGIEHLYVPFEEIRDLKRILDSLGGCRVVMLGEATHGTHEFYEWRRLISSYLIENLGFRFIAVEGDWPPCWKVNDYIHSRAEGDARDALMAFQRWPTWMWANSDIWDLVTWMKRYNDNSADEDRVSFYGLDVYSLFESVDEVIRLVSEIKPALAKEVRERYACFDPFERDEKAYARSLIKNSHGCEREVLETLLLLLDLKDDHISVFNAQQNARIVANAENYYRTMVEDEEDPWNVRDSHMHDTLEHLFRRHGENSKAIIWAHNTHIGDYRATDMVERGQINIGGLARQKWGDEAVALIGFGTYEGEVIASPAWGGPTVRMTVPPGREGSIEHGFHQAALRRDVEQFVLDLRDHRDRFREVRPHRAIGVVYNPRYDQFANYVPTSLSERYDVFLFFDRTTALRPLVQELDRTKLPETWPLGL